MISRTCSAHEATKLAWWFFTCSSELLSSGFMAGYQWQLSEGKVHKKKIMVAKGYLGLSPEGEVSQVFIDGPFSNQKHLHRLKEAVKNGLHYKSMKAFDGKAIQYGPGNKEQMQKKIDKLIPKLENFLNVNLHRKNTIYFRDGSKDTDPKETPAFTWCADFFKPTRCSKPKSGAIGDDRWIIQCELEIEPFDGRLISIMVWHRE